MISKVLLVLACATLVLAQYQAPSKSNSPNNGYYTVPSPSKSKAPSPSKSNSPNNGYYTVPSPSKSQSPMNYGYGGYKAPSPSKSKMPECEDKGYSFVNGYKSGYSSKESSNKGCGYKVMEPMKMKEGMSINYGSYLDVYNDIDVDDDFMIDTGSYLNLYGGKVTCKSATIKGTYEVHAENDYMVSSYGPATVDGYLNVKLPINYDFKFGAKLVILKFAALIGKFKGYRVSYDNDYSNSYSNNNNGYKRSVEARDEQEGQEVAAELTCTATECAIVSRVAPDAEATAAEGAPNNTRKLALAIGLGAGVPIVVAMFIAVVVVARRRRSQEAAEKNYDVEATRGATSAAPNSTVSSTSEAGVSAKSSVSSADLVGTNNSSVSSV